MKIVFFGTPDFAVPTLKKIINSKYELCAIVTQPDRRKGRGMNFCCSPVKDAAKDMKIPIYQPERINKDKDIIKKIEELEPDIFIVIAYGQIFSKKVISIPKIFSINLHGSILPKYRGASPIQASLLNGDNKTGITSIKMTREMDKGDILLIKECKIESNDNLALLHDKLSLLAAETCLETLDNLDNIVSLKQDENKAIYCKKITKDMGKISFDNTAENILNQIKAFSIFPGIQVKYENSILKIHNAEIIKKDVKNIKPGEILWANQNELIVACKENSLKITVLQRVGKRKLDYSEFQKGFQFQKGNFFKRV